MDKTIRQFGKRLAFCGMVVLLAAGTAPGQGTGIVTGKVTDRADGSALWGANVLVVGTSIGASTDDAGKYRIQVTAGNIRIAVRYLGYETAERDVEVRADQTVEVNVPLRASVIPQDEVVVTAQLRGQQAAVNQQLTSNSIVNVLSQDRIRELPDQNAAESIARLPGISVERSGGEAQKVIIRGLESKYVNITINGEKVPSTDVVDRSVDLSSVSSDMLAGIEVFKSPTPDRDGDALAGTINFAMRKAAPEQRFDVKMQGGYNSLERSYGDNRGSIDYSNRFLDDNLGLVLTGNFQRANRGSDAQEESYALSYEPTPGSPIPYKIDDMRLVDRKEIRNRYGASLALDYDLDEDNSFLATGFWSKTNRDEARRRHRYNIQESREEYDYQDHTIGTQLFTFGLNGTHSVSVPIAGTLDVRWRVANSQSNQRNPNELYGRFFQMGLSGVVANQGPEAVPPSVTSDLNNTWLKELVFASERAIDRNWTYQLDVKRLYSLGDLLSGHLKFGAKLYQKSRERDRTQNTSNTVIETALGLAIYNNPSAFYRSFPLTSDVNHKVLMSGFLSPDDKIGEFLVGKYNTWPSIEGGAIHDFWNNMRTWATSTGIPLFDNDGTRLEDKMAMDNSYTAEEGIFAGYAMTEIRLGEDVLVVPGVRYERTKNNYKTKFRKTGSTAEDTPSIIAVTDSTGDTSYDDWLPMVQFRVNVTEGINVRGSVAKTLARPNYYDLVPYEMINFSGSPRTIQKGNPDLKHLTALNYDLYLSFFNRYGLFSLGGFYKTIDNVSYLRTSYIRSGTYNGFRLIQPVNADDPSTVYGGEVEVQANLTLLPEPFDGLVVSGNIALMKSKTLYPRFQVTNRVLPTPPFLVVEVLDTVREAPMRGQANMMGNFTIGYERGGFAGRLSLIFQGKSLAIVGTRPEMDGYIDPYYRWDLAVQQKLFAGISLFLNVNNITNVPDKSVNEQYITSEQYYGWSTEVGVRFKL